MKLAYENRYEFLDSPFDTNVYTVRQFLMRVFIASILNRECWDCNGRGRKGYYEPEDCSTCDGFGINWKNEPEPDWEEMVKGMREYDEREASQTP